RRGPAWRSSHAGHVSLGQLKVMSAIERCRTAALGGHVERCEDCAHLRISYNSCRDRHCPKCQAAAAKQWLADRQAELLPVPYFHVVFSLPRPIADIGYQNKAVVYDLLLKTAAETLITIAADPKHLGARIGPTAVLHTWGSALTHHPHAHVIVPDGRTKGPCSFLDPPSTAAVSPTCSIIRRSYPGEVGPGALHPSPPRGTEGSNPSPSSGESVSRPHPLSKVQNPGFPRGCARLAWCPGRQRRSACFDSAPACGNISVGPYSSTAVPVTVVGENTMPAPTMSGLPRGQRAVDR